MFLCLFFSVQVKFITTDSAANMASMIQDYAAIVEGHLIDFDKVEGHIMYVFVFSTLFSLHLLTEWQMLSPPTSYFCFDNAAEMYKQWSTWKYN